MDSAQYHQDKDDNYIKNEGQKTIYEPKGLKIIWGKDRRYWKIDDKAAELLQVCWLEVTGTKEKLKPKTTYKISFEMKLEPHAFGWEGIKFYVMAKVGAKGRYTRKRLSFDNDTEFSVIVDTGYSNDLTLYFGLYEVFSGAWKGGLKIYKAIVEII